MNETKKKNVYSVLHSGFLSGLFFILRAEMLYSPETSVTSAGQLSFKSQKK
jgi:hypothetical protein